MSPTICLKNHFHVCDNLINDSNQWQHASNCVTQVRLIDNVERMNSQTTVKKLINTWQLSLHMSRHYHTRDNWVQETVVLAITVPKLGFFLDPTNCILLSLRSRGPVKCPRKFHKSERATSHGGGRLTLCCWTWSAYISSLLLHLFSNLSSDFSVLKMVYSPSSHCHSFFSFLHLPFFF